MTLLFYGSHHFPFRNTTLEAIQVCYPILWPVTLGPTFNPWPCIKRLSTPIITPDYNHIKIALCEISNFVLKVSTSTFRIFECHLVSDFSFHIWIPLTSEHSKTKMWRQSTYSPTASQTAVRLESCERWLRSTPYAESRSTPSHSTVKTSKSWSCCNRFFYYYERSPTPQGQTATSRWGFQLTDLLLISPNSS